MADVKALIGSAWGVPVRGAIVNLTSADVNSILSAASGLAKGLFLLGGGAIALALAAVGLFALLPPKREALPWGTLAKIETWSGWNPGLFGGRKFTRRFQGVCLTKEIRFSSDNHVFTVPVDYIEDYHSSTEAHGFFKKRTSIRLDLELFDKSKYVGTLLSPTAFEFLTPLGKQTVPCESYHDIYGCTVAEAEALRLNMDGFLEKEAQTAEKLLGAEQFRRFFLRT
jgi:hypothetical protein